MKVKKETYYCEKLQTCIPDEPCKKIRHLGTAKTLGGGSDKMFTEVMCSCPLPQQSCPSTESSQGHAGTRTKASHQYYPMVKMDPFLGPQPQSVRPRRGIRSRVRDIYQMIDNLERKLDKTYSTPGFQDTMLDLYQETNVFCRPLWPRDDPYQNLDSNTNTNSVGNYFYNSSSNTNCIGNEFFNSSSNTNYQPELFFQYQYLIQ